MVERGEPRGSLEQAVEHRERLVEHSEDRRIGPFIRLLEANVERLSTDAALPMLGLEERWELIADVLLGHPPIRGGARPRDYPMGVARSASSDLARLLWALDAPTASADGVPPDLRSHRPKVRLFDWLVAARIARAVQRSESTDLEGETDAAGLIGLTLHRVLGRLAEQEHREFRRHLRSDIGLEGGRDELRASRAAKDDERLAGARLWLGRLLGMTRADLARGGVAASGAFLYGALSPKVQSLDRLAALAASSARALASLVREGSDLLARAPEQRVTVVCDRMGIAPELLEELREVSFSVVRIRPRHVQEVLRRAKSSYIQRGASAWCSQALGAVRDHLCRSGFTLLSDMDGFELLVGPAGTSPAVVAGLVGDYLNDHHAFGPRLAEGFPRLAPTLRQAANEGRSARPLFPDFGLSVQPANLFQFALGASAWDKDHRPEDESGYLLVPSQPAPGVRTRETRCVGILGDEPLLHDGFQVPAWYADTDADERYSLTATAYSLAGAGYRAMTAQGLLDAIREETGRRLHAEPREGDRLRRLAEETGGSVRTLFLVRADGNDVGKRFIEAPPLLRPGLSALLEAELRERFTKTVIELVRRHPRLSVLPVDLVYLGGDDLQFTVVDVMLYPLLDLLFDAAPVEPRGVPDLSVKLAAVEYPATRSHRDRAKGKDSVDRARDALPRHVWAHRAVDLVIEAAKSELVPETPAADALLRSAGRGFPLPDEWRWSLSRHDRPGRWQALVLRRATEGDAATSPA